MPDITAQDLDILFVGINPGLWSGAVGHHFAHPNNRFWKVLFGAGLTAELLDPSQERRLLDEGLGITNLVSRTTASAAELSKEELRAGGRTLARKVRRLHPARVAFVGMGAYRTALHRPSAAPGRQEERLERAEVWVLPNPSGLQARYQLDDLVAMYGALGPTHPSPAARRGARRGQATKRTDLPTP